MNRNVSENVIGALLWLVLIVVSGSLWWVIIGSLGASGLTLAVHRRWAVALEVGVVVGVIISILGIASMISPGWYEGVLP